MLADLLLYARLQLVLRRRESARDLTELRRAVQPIRARQMTTLLPLATLVSYLLTFL